jgi:hypothetical protein
MYFLLSPSFYIKKLGLIPLLRKYQFSTIKNGDSTQKYLQ